jgi:hypothetical protein
MILKNGVGEKIYRDPICQESKSVTGKDKTETKNRWAGKFIATQFSFFKNIY